MAWVQILYNEYFLKTFLSEIERKIIFKKIFLDVFKYSKISQNIYKYDKISVSINDRQ